jgi:hypothetical protein
MQTKQCSKCREVKDVELFYRSAYRKGGRDTHCKACKKADNAKHRQANLEAYGEYRKVYMRGYEASKRESDPFWRFKVNTRKLIGASFKRARDKEFYKSRATLEMLGCSYEHFVSHISSQFTEGMTLENYGQWHLDHITPLATASTQEDIVRLNHYTNFQPLWAKDNLSKGAKII